MTPAELAARIDHTILKPEATSAEVHRVATEAMQARGFAEFAFHFAAKLLAARPT